MGFVFVAEEKRLAWMLLKPKYMNPLRCWAFRLLGVFFLPVVLCAQMIIEDHPSHIPMRILSPNPDQAYELRPANRFLVRFKKAKTPAGWKVRSAVSILPDSNVWRIEVETGRLIPLEYLQSRDIEYIEPDTRIHVAAPPNDPLFPQQWNLQKIQAPAAWDIQVGAPDVVVAVLDTGVDYSHLDLKNNLWSNPGDGTHGFSCFNGTITSNGDDDYGHGTHVAGIIGAEGNNSLGVSGILWQAKLLSAKFMDSTGSGYTSDAILCINQLLQLKKQGTNIRIVNMSFGSPVPDPALKDAVDQLEQAGILTVAASGNFSMNTDQFRFYPASFDNRGLISVINTMNSDAIDRDSDYGAVTTDVAAPGNSIVSTVPQKSCSLCDPGGYLSLSGTSMAAPHVSGLAAAILQRNPNLTIYQLRDLILDPLSLDPLTDLKAATSSTGGRINLLKALSNPDLFTNPPLNQFPTVSARAFATEENKWVTFNGNGSDPDGDPVRLSWARPFSEGLLHGVLQEALPYLSDNPFSFVSPSFARDVTVGYLVGASDGRGGSSEKISYITVKKSAHPGTHPTGTLQVSNPKPSVGEIISITMPSIDPEGRQVYWSPSVFHNNVAIRFWPALYEHVPVRLSFNESGLWYVVAQIMDSELNFTDTQTVLIDVGGTATGKPPIGIVSADVLSGAVPLTVNFDASRSYDSDGSITSRIVYCDRHDDGSAQTGFYSGPTGRCIYQTPGPKKLEILTFDNENRWTINDVFIMVQPAVLQDLQDPQVSLTDPGDPLLNPVNLLASATDDGGISRVQFYANDILLGTDYTQPYGITVTLVPGEYRFLLVRTIGWETLQPPRLT